MWILVANSTENLLINIAIYAVLSQYYVFNDFQWKRILGQM